jgi:3-oxoacyl-[acyl-carrier protein] reductase
MVLSAPKTFYWSQDSRSINILATHQLRIEGDMPGDLHAQVALVTGGGSGIGLATALKLAQHGACIAVADIDASRGGEAVERLNHAGADAIFALTDVASEDSVEVMVKAVIGWRERIDILVHCAGVGIERSFLETSLAEWQRVIGIDLTGSFLCCRAVARHMVSRRYGRIVTIASTAGIRGGTGRAAYGAAKGGVIALTKVMAIELAGSGVTVNGLAPGAIETELVREMHSETTRRVYTAAIPMDRYGTPAETAAAAAFLASPGAAYITGQILGVDGGFLAAGVLHK